MSFIVALIKLNGSMACPNEFALIAVEVDERTNNSQSKSLNCMLHEIKKHSADFSAPRPKKIESHGFLGVGRMALNIFLRSA